MAGYTRKKKTYLLVFGDPDMEGLIVRCRALTIRELDAAMAAPGMTYGAALERDIQRLTGQPTDEWPYPPGIIDWNLEDDDGNSMPIAPESLLESDPAFVYAIARAWAEASAGVSVPLERRSTSGDSFPEESIPMETRSESPTSLTGQSES